MNPQTVISDLLTALKQEAWWSLANSYFSSSPTGAVICMTYRGRILHMYVSYVPYKDAFRIDIGRGTPYKRPRSIEGAVEVVRQGLCSHTEYVDYEIKQEKQREENEQLAQEHWNETAKQFGVTLKHPQTGYTSPDYFMFQFSKNYTLKFIEHAGKFNITHITGKYSMEQIKELIDWLSRCPQAVVERMLRGK
jgi:hypothetical protein